MGSSSLRKDADPSGAGPVPGPPRPKALDARALEQARALVGPVTLEHLRYVDSYVTARFGIFVPSVGQCGYAITPNHGHPAYSFLLTFGPESPLAPAGLEVPEGMYAVTAMSPGLPHEEEPSESFTRYVAILVEGALFEAEYALYGSGAPGRLFWTPFLVGTDFLGGVRQFIAEHDAGLPGAHRVLEALGLRLTHRLIRGLLTVDLPAEPGVGRFEIDRVVEHMHERFGDRLSVEELASVAGLSASHFARLFRRETGEAPMEFLQRLRVRKAQALLQKSSLSLTEIAQRCGFSSSSHFSACFRAAAGMPPSEYRKRSLCPKP